MGSPEQHYLQAELHELMQNNPGLLQPLQIGTNDGLWAWDIERPDQAWMCPKFKSHFGYEDHEVPNSGSWWRENILPEDQVRIEDNLHRAYIDPGRPYEQIVRYRHRNGSVVWIRCRALALRAADGRVVRVVGAHTDVTAIKETEEQFHASVILESIGDAVLIVDATGIVRFANPAAAKMLAHDSRELLGRPFGLPLTNNQTSELGITRSDGTSGIAEMRVAETIWDGQFAHLASLRDITEHKQAQSRLHQSESTMIAAQRIAHFGSWELELIHPEINANRLRWSDETFRIFGLEPASVQASNELFFSLVHPDDRQAIMDAVSQALRDGSEYSIVHRIVRAQGEIRYIEEHARVFVDERTGKPYKMVGTVHDITERQKALEELRLAKETAERATRAKSQFLAMMSHEIRTPLNPILGAVQLLLDQGGSEEQRELLHLINNAGEHLLMLLNDILDLAKMEAGSIDLVTEQVHAPLLVQGVFEIKSEEAAQKGLLFTHELDKTLAPGYLGDLARLRQILLNLVGNAIKFTSVGGVTVRVERLNGDERRDHLRFSVRDTGIGIDAGHLQHIFDPFYQADSSNSRRYEGAGLGLAICRRLVNAMNGELGVESDSGRGSTFWFTVWMELDPTATFDTVNPFPVRRTATVRRVLLVEDDPQNTVVLRSMLERSRCEVTVAADGHTALGVFNTSVFDLVLLDLYLPDMDGREVARRLRSLESLRNAGRVPIIAQSASSGTGDIFAIKGAGMDGFLSKPIQMRNLVQILNHFAPLPEKAPPPRRKSTSRPGFKVSPAKSTKSK